MEARDPYDGRGTSALVYLDPDTFVPWAIRIFDSAGRLVRVYEDFQMRAGGGSIRLESFRITSVPTSSHSLFRIERIAIR
jgi:hypothetical protein